MTETIALKILLTLVTAAVVPNNGTDQILQTVVVGLFSGGLVSGIFALVTKRARSPESQNELARLGNDFASKMLEDARIERRELRETIKELEQSNNTKQATIDRLKLLAEEKDKRIDELEARRHIVASKLQAGEKITLADIFGKDAPSNVRVVVESDESVA